MNQFSIINKRLLSICTSSLSYKLSQQQRVYLSTIGYVTDVEGNLDYWRRYLSISNVLETDHSTGQIHLRDNCQFVYGGDVCDRGSGCMRIMSDLISLKERYKDRVHLILGNRDINKLRIQASIHEAVLQCPPRTYWVKSPMEDIIPAGYKLGDVESKMKWMLARTMGAPISYEMRQLELQALGATETPWQSFLDWTDPESGQLVRYLELGQLAARFGDVLFVHGAVHRHNVGWLPPTRETNPLLPLVPSVACSYHPKSSLLQRGQYIHACDEWIYRLNAFMQSEIADYRANIHKFLDTLTDPTDSNTQGLPTGIEQIWDTSGGYDHPQPGSRLLQYGMGRLPDGALNPSVVYSSYMRQRHVPHKSMHAVGSAAQSGATTATSSASVSSSTSSAHKAVHPVSTIVTEPAPIEREAAEYLRSAGVQRVVVGHQPVGDAPLFMQAHGVQMLSADTAYSSTVQWPLSQLQHIYRNFNSPPAATTASESASTDFTDSSTTTGSSTTSSSTGLHSFGPNTTSGTEAVEEDEWCTAMQYIHTNQLQLEERSHAAGVEKKSTRSPVAGFEVIFQVPDSESYGGADKSSEPYNANPNPTSSNSSRSTTSTSMSVSGYLSTGNYFHHLYPSPNLLEVEERHAAYDQTECGWRCRISNVHSITNTSTNSNTTSSTTPICTAEEGENKKDDDLPSVTYNLYSKVEGFTFQNKLFKHK